VPLSQHQTEEACDICTESKPGTLSAVSPGSLAIGDPPGFEPFPVQQ